MVFTPKLKPKEIKRKADHCNGSVSAALFVAHESLKVPSLDIGQYEFLTSERSLLRIYLKIKAFSLSNPLSLLYVSRVTQYPEMRAYNGISGSS